MKPFVLLSNDDGFDAGGLRFLVELLKDRFELMVVAPAFERSGASHSISLKDEMALQERAPNQYAFDGTPVDCVLFALRNLVERKPDFLISGINHGANLGNDTLYSGTVGAALAGASHGIPSIALSLCDYHPRKSNHFQHAGYIIEELFKREPFLVDYQKKVINVNIPNVEKLEGIKVTRLGERIYGEEFVRGEVKDTYRYDHADVINFGGDGFDVTEVSRGCASLSVLEPSLYDLHANSKLSELFSSKV